MNPETAIRDTSTQRLGYRLRRARLTRNMTQGEVAKGQFSVSYISAVERGQIRPSLGALERLADRLAIPVTDLLGEAEIDIKGAPSSEGREGGTERLRDDIETRLREASILSSQGKSHDALAVLSRISTQQLSARESASLRLLMAAAYNRQGRADDARREAQEGLTNAERLGDVELIGKIYSELGDAYSALDSYPLALDSYRAGLRAVESNPVMDRPLRFTLLSRIGIAHTQIGDHTEALANLQHAVAAAPDVMNLEAVGATYLAISQAYASKGNSAPARVYAMRSLAAYEAVEHRRLVAQVHTQLGSELAQAGQLDEARTQLHTAYEVASAQKDTRGLAEAHRHLARVYLAEHNVAEAAKAGHEALTYAEELGDDVQRAEALLILAQVDEQQGATAKAEQHFEEAVNLLQASDTTEQLRSAYALYSEFLERRGENARAFEMLKQAYRSAARSGASI